MPWALRDILHPAQGLLYSRAANRIQYCACYHQHARTNIACFNFFTYRKARLENGKFAMGHHRHIPRGSSRQIHPGLLTCCHRASPAQAGTAATQPKGQESFPEAEEQQQTHPLAEELQLKLPTSPYRSTTKFCLHSRSPRFRRKGSEKPPPRAQHSPRRSASSRQSAARRRRHGVTAHLNAAQTRHADPGQLRRITGGRAVTRSPGGSRPRPRGPRVFGMRLTRSLSKENIPGTGLRLPSSTTTHEHSSPAAQALKAKTGA